MGSDIEICSALDVPPGEQKAMFFFEEPLFSGDCLCVSEWGFSPSGSRLTLVDSHSHLLLPGTPKCHEGREGGREGMKVNECKWRRVL